MELQKLLQLQGFDWGGWFRSTPEAPFTGAWKPPGPPLPPPPAPKPPPPPSKACLRRWTIGCPLPTNGTCMEGANLFGNDLSEKKGLPDAEHCHALCKATAACAAYVFQRCEKHAGHRHAFAAAPEHDCFLKHAVAKQTPSQNPGCTLCSGVVVGHHPAPGPKPNEHKFFPVNQTDADAIGSNSWMPNVNRQWTHGVNGGQALMVYAQLYRLHSNASALEEGRRIWRRVDDLHGQANGVFSADECLSGRQPTRGTETCTVVETMMSLGEMRLATGDVWYADKLETIALNALPGVMNNGSMWAMTYFNQVNKIQAMDVSKGKCNVGAQYGYGLVYECCVANHMQGWPKYVARALSTTASGGLIVSQYFDFASQPVQLSSMRTRRLHNTAMISVSGGYPFGEKISLNITSTSSLQLSLRVPSWCLNASIACAHNGCTGIQHPLNNGTLATVTLPSGSATVTFSLPMAIRVVRRPPTNAANIYRGPLLYALPVGYELETSEPYDQKPGRLPLGQGHGQNYYYKGDTKNNSWAAALVLGDDANPAKDMRYVDRRATVHSPPKGQGVFQTALVPGAIAAKVRALPASIWGLKHDLRPSTSAYSRRGNVATCTGGGSHATQKPFAPHEVVPEFEQDGSHASHSHASADAAYTTAWCADPPRSPLSPTATGIGAPREVLLLPFGATDVRIGEIPTVQK